VRRTSFAQRAARLAAALALAALAAGPSRAAAQTVPDSGGGDGVDPNALPYGPDTCISGYVWRGAYEGDHVCVTPETRDQAAADNAAAESRRVPGSADCVSGYVWRVARPEDLVCVTPETRDQTAADNAAASQRFVAPHDFVAPPADELTDTGNLSPQPYVPPR
jgi:hypothetical protein